jgi:hypothetical protein
MPNRDIQAAGLLSQHGQSVESLVVAGLCVQDLPIKSPGLDQAPRPVVRARLVQRRVRGFVGWSMRGFGRKGPLAAGYAHPGLDYPPGGEGLRFQRSSPNPAH